MYDYLDDVTTTTEWVKSSRRTGQSVPIRANYNLAMYEAVILT